MPNTLQVNDAMLNQPSDKHSHVIRSSVVDVLLT